MYAKILFFVAIVSTSLWGKNIGHRLGGDLYQPGDTLYSLRHLIAQADHDPKLQYLEYDIQETRDGRLVVFHDIPSIARIVPATRHNLQILSNLLKYKPLKRIRIHDLTLDQIRHLRLDHNATIPTLQDVLRYTREHNITHPQHIEIKRLYTDSARERLIATVEKYRDHLPLELIAFRRNYELSFPWPDRWLSRMKAAGIPFYQIGRYDFTAELSENNASYQTLIDRPFAINRTHGRHIEYPLKIPRSTHPEETLLIGLYGARDDTGNHGINLRITTADYRSIFSAFADKKHWQWFKIPRPAPGAYRIMLNDYDTSFTGKYPGNGGQIKVILQHKRQ